MGSSKERRRRLFVHPKIQGNLAAQAIVQWSLFLVATVGLLFGLQFLADDPFRPFAEHCELFLRRYAVVVVVLFAMTPAVIYQSIKTSNRLVGPLLRLRNEMTRLAHGEEVQPIRLRRGDVGNDVVEAFNTMLLALNERSRQGIEHDPDTPDGSTHNRTPSELIGAN